MNLLRKYAPVLRDTSKYFLRAIALMATAVLVFVVSSAVIFLTLYDIPLIVGLGVILLGFGLMIVTAVLLIWMRSVMLIDQRLDGLQCDITNLDARLPGKKLPA